LSLFLLTVCSLFGNIFMILKRFKISLKAKEVRNMLSFFTVIVNLAIMVCLGLGQGLQVDILASDSPVCNNALRPMASKAALPLEESRECAELFKAFVMAKEERRERDATNAQRLLGRLEKNIVRLDTHSSHGQDSDIAIECAKIQLEVGRLLGERSYLQGAKKWCELAMEFARAPGHDEMHVGRCVAIIELKAVIEKAMEDLDEYMAGIGKIAGQGMDRTMSYNAFLAYKTICAAA